MSAISCVCDQTPGHGVLLQEEGGCVLRTGKRRGKAKRSLKHAADLLRGDGSKAHKFLFAVGFPIKHHDFEGEGIGLGHFFSL